MQSAQTITFEVDVQKKIEPMKPIWAWFGYDEPNYTYMKDGKKLLTELSEMSYTPVNVRVHNLLTTGDGTPALKWGSTNAYTEDKKGRPIYDWTIVDSIFDTFIVRGMKPLVEIGFMPKALSVKPDPYQHTWSPANAYNLCASGLSTALKDMVKMKSLLGIGKCGMSLILVIGKELSKSIVNFMTMQLMALKKLFREHV